MQSNTHTGKFRNIAETLVVQPATSLLHVFPAPETFNPNKNINNLRGEISGCKN